MAKEAVCWHILDLCVPKDDICESSPLDLLNHLGWVGVLEPESISISNTAELDTSNSCTELTEH